MADETSPSTPNEASTKDGGDALSATEPKPLAEPADDVSTKGDAAAKIAAPAADDAAKTGATAAAVKPAEPPAPKRYWFLAAVSVVTLALDLGSKEWAKHHVGGTRPGSNGPHIIFALAHNPGGAFGILGDESKMIREPFFLLISVLAVIFIVSLYRKLTPRQHALRWGLPLVLGGALGNLHDRVRFGQVVDFIDAYWRSGVAKESHWPTFNIADVAIVAGVILMAVDMFQTRKPKDAPVAGKPVAPAAETKLALPDAAPAPAPAGGDAGTKASD